MVRTSLVSEAWGVFFGVTQPVATCANPCIARVLLQQSDQNQCPSFSKINLTSKSYNGEWALVGEFVKQLGQFALGEFCHPALANTYFLAEAARTTGV